MDEKELHRNALVLASQALGMKHLTLETDNSTLQKELAAYLNKLIVKDFNLLIAILYRIDIPQDKAVAALAENSTKESAGDTLTKLILDRQKQKLYFRNLYKSKHQ